jgi:hypothetical protein
LDDCSLLRKDLLAILNGLQNVPGSNVNPDAGFVEAGWALQIQLQLALVYDKFLYGRIPTKRTTWGVSEKPGISNPL